MTTAASNTSSSTPDPGSRTPAARPVEAPAPVPFTRLVLVESRKFVDTRISWIMTAFIVVLSLGAMTGRAAVVGPGPELVGTVTVSGAVLGTLLPVLGILSVTSEWSHHTALTTFAVEPRRGRVVAAKCVPPVLVVLAASVVLIGAGYAVVGAVSAVQGTPADWGVDGRVLLGWVAVNIILVLNGVAFGALLLNAPAAIIVVVASTMAWGLIGLAGRVGATAADWLDLNRTSGPLLDGGAVTGGELARLAVSVAVWVVLPLAIGAVRVIRGEVR